MLGESLDYPEAERASSIRDTSLGNMQQSNGEAGRVNANHVRYGGITILRKRKDGYAQSVSLERARVNNCVVVCVVAATAADSG